MNKEIEKMVKVLLEEGWTIATMESCTGGGMANAITNVPGVSKAFKFSATTYSNDFKVKMGVKKSVIDKYSVYSFQTAEEMSKKIAAFTGATFGVGITGKLKRADSSNEVGDDDVVFVCVYNSRTNKCHHDRIKVYADSREENKKTVISAAAKLVMKAMEKENLNAVEENFKSV